MICTILKGVHEQMENPIEEITPANDECEETPAVETTESTENEIEPVCPPEQIKILPSTNDDTNNILPEKQDEKPSNSCKITRIEINIQVKTLN